MYVYICVCEREMGDKVPKDKSSGRALNTEGHFMSNNSIRILYKTVAK